MRFSVSILTAIAISLSSTFSAIANPKQLNLTIITRQDQTFSSLLKEAETLVKDSIPQNFQSSKGVTELTIYIIGERNGVKVPILSAQISQSDGQKNPQINSWIKYFPNADVLLGFVKNTQIVKTTAPPTNSKLTVRNRLYPSENEPNFYNK